jgi:hypothetical protein
MFLKSPFHNQSTAEPSMKSISTAIGPFAAILAMAVLTACVTPQQTTPADSEHHPDSRSAQASGAMGGGQSGTQMSMKDMQAMCDMHKKMVATKTPEEHQAMMDEKMKSMSPEMKQKHMQMMQEQCK